MRCYLAGPITGFSYADVTGWREKAVKMLSRMGISAYSPMRGKEQLAGFMDVYYSPTGYISVFEFMGMYSFMYSATENPIRAFVSNDLFSLQLTNDVSISIRCVKD